MGKIADSRKELGEIESLHRPQFLNDRYFTGEQLRVQFSICKKTLQAYRDNGIIAHTSIGGKFLYRESDILKILEENYRPTIRDYLA